jgi:hypothetical protein
VQDVGYAALQVIPSFDGFQGKLERGTRGPLSSAGSKGGRVFGDSAGRSMVSAISSHAKHAAFLAAGAFSAAAAGGIVLLRGSFAEARESQKVAALTASTIKATGGAANESAKDIDRLSNAIGKKAAIDDETVASGLNMLLTFKNVRNEVGKGNKIFDKAGQTVTDMAAAMAASSGGEVDLKSASIQVGKALNDPVKGITALSRVGVTFTQQQKDQINAMVAAGDTMGAQKIILRELSSEFGGAAKSQATDADRVAFAWGNAEEKLGTALLPVMKDFNRFLLRDAIPGFEHYVDVFQKKGIPALEHFAKKARPVAEDVLPALGDVLGTVKDDLVIAAPYAKDLVDAFRGMPDWAKKAIVGGGLAAFAGSKLNLGSALTGGKGAGGGLLGVLSKSKPLPVYVVNGMGGLTGAGGVAGEGGALIAGGSRVKGTRGGRLRSRVRGGVKGAAALAALDALSHFITSGTDSETSDAVNNTITGASIGAFGGPQGAALGAGFGALYDAYNSTPNKDLPVSKYEHNLAGKENWAAQMNGTAGGDFWQKSIATLNTQLDAASRHPRRRQAATTTATSSARRAWQSSRLGGITVHGGLSRRNVTSADAIQQGHRRDRGSAS